jgi:hypothetical protein
VVQTAPGKFVTASGHAIKTSTAAGGIKTIIRTAPNFIQVCIPINPMMNMRLFHYFFVLDS